MVRVRNHCKHVRQIWRGGLPFPNPLQSIVLALWIGLCFLLGGSERISAPTYNVIRTYGGETLWGLGYVIVTVALFVTWRWFHHGLFLAYVAAASGYLMFAVSVARAASTVSSVSWIATGVFAWLSWVHAMAANRVSGDWKWVTRRRE